MRYALQQKEIINLKRNNTNFNMNNNLLMNSNPCPKINFGKKNDIPKCFSPRLEFLKISNELFKLKYRTNKKRSNSKNSRNKTNSTFCF